MVGERKSTRRTALSALTCGLLASRAPGQGTVLRLRSRSRTDAIHVREQDLLWKPAGTAIVICDMWDNHYCQSSAGRVHLIASHLNAMVAKARTLPVEIIHALSGTMDVYADPAK